MVSQGDSIGGKSLNSRTEKENRMVGFNRGLCPGIGRSEGVEGLRSFNLDSESFSVQVKSREILGGPRTMVSNHRTMTNVLLVRGFETVVGDF